MDKDNKLKSVVLTMDYFWHTIT